MSLGGKNKKDHTQEGIVDLNVTDLILIDHRFLKNCIGLFSSKDTDKQLKINKARSFLAAFSLHHKAEAKAVYQPLENHPEFHFQILESQKVHAELDRRVKALKRRFNNMVYLRDEVEMELKAVAEMISQHLLEEEKETLPLMNRNLDDETLRLLGCSFMAERKFSHDDLKDYPGQQDDLIKWKDNVQKISSEFLSKTDKFAESLQH